MVKLLKEFVMILIFIQKLKAVHRDENYLAL